MSLPQYRLSTQTLADWMRSVTARAKHVLGGIYLTRSAGRPGKAAPRAPKPGRRNVVVRLARRGFNRCGTDSRREGMSRGSTQDRRFVRFACRRVANGLAGQPGTRCAGRAVQRPARTGREVPTAARHQQVDTPRLRGGDAMREWDVWKTASPTGLTNILANKTGMSSEEIVKQMMSIGVDEPKGGMGKPLDPLGWVATLSGYRSTASLGCIGNKRRPLWRCGFGKRPAKSRSRPRKFRSSASSIRRRS